MTDYIRIYGPGHFWLQVPIDDVKKVGVLDQITPYSPKKGNPIYLEEDQDLDTFFTAM